MVDEVEFRLSAAVLLPTPDETDRLARALADAFKPGDVILIEGPIGAGKSHFCRAAIRHLLNREGRDEEIPSPTFTLVQTYELGEFDIWHADLYRLSDPAQTVELGLDDAFETAVVLVEWPDRLGELAPGSALGLRLKPVGDAEGRVATFTASDPRWREVAVVVEHFAAADAIV